MPVRIRLPQTDEERQHDAWRELSIDLWQLTPGEPTLIVEQQLNGRLVEWRAAVPVAVLQQLAGLGEQAARIAAASAQRTIELEVREALLRTLRRVMREGEA